MICDKCGKEIADGAQVCPECGAEVEVVVEEAPQAEEQAASSDEAAVCAECECGADCCAEDGDFDFEASYEEFLEDKIYRQRKTSKAIAAVLAAVTAVTLMMSWFSFTLPPNVLQEGKETRLAFTSFGIPGFFNIFQPILEGRKTQMEEQLTMIEEYKASASEEDLAANNEQIVAMTESSNEGISQAEIALSACKTGIISGYVVMALAVLALLALMLFVYMLFVGGKGSFIVGITGNALAVLAAVGIFVLVKVAGTSMGGAFDSMFNEGSKLGVAVWVYVAAALALVNAAWVVLRKWAVVDEEICDCCEEYDFGEEETCDCCE